MISHQLVISCSLVTLLVAGQDVHHRWKVSTEYSDSQVSAMLYLLSTFKKLEIKSIVV